MRAGVLLLSLVLPAAAWGEGKLQVVNLIPLAESGESQPDSQPSLAVNPVRRQLLVVGAERAAPAGAPYAPLLVSTDGGTSWVSRLLVPGQPGARPGVHDLDLAWNGAGTTLYAALLRAAPGQPDDLEFQLLRSADSSLASPLVVVARRLGPDRPFLQVATARGLAEPGAAAAGAAAAMRERLSDRLFVGLHQAAVAELDQSADAGAGSPRLSSARLEPGGASVDHLVTRVALHPSGTVYAAFYRRTAATTASGSALSVPAEVVVVRDDDWGRASPPFSSLVDGASRQVGQRAVTGITLSFDLAGGLGGERDPGDLALAVDPGDHRRVYLAYQDRGPDGPSLHLRQSFDGGQSWAGDDLLLVRGGKAVGLAVNHHGRLAVVYQQLAGAGAAARWQTHFRRRDDSGAWDDAILASTELGAGARAQRLPGLADHGSLLAVGRDFHGVFAALNRPDPANFPSGVVWQRRVDVGTRQLRNLGGAAEVPPSIDPFYFRYAELGADADFFIRDWVEGRDQRDDGQEPGLQARVFDSGDLWLRRENDPGPRDARDRAVHEEPHPLPGRPQFAFVRAARALGGSAATVRVDLYVADAGIGTNFRAAGSGSLPFASAELEHGLAAGQGIAWEPAATASGHVNLAVELSTASDPPLGTLLGHAPGWPNPDRTIADDNNQAVRSAQRLLGAAGTTVQAYAIVHNAALITRDLALSVELPPELQQVTLRVIGGEGRKEGAVLTLPQMAPAENRWVEVGAAVPAAAAGRVAPVRLFEVWRGRRIGGHTIEIRSAAAAELAREAVLEQQAVLGRIAAATEIAVCAEQSKAAAALASAMNAAREAERAGAYASWVHRQAAGLAGCAGQLVQLAGGKDPFGLAAAARELGSASDGNRRAALHGVLLARLDAAESWRQKAAGDVADAVQVVSWQSALYRDRAELKPVPGAAGLVSDGEAFVRAWDQHRAGVDDYARLVKRSQSAYRATAARLPGRGLEALVAAMARLLDAAGAPPAALERLHRDFLFRLAAVAATGEPGGSGT